MKVSFQLGNIPDELRALRQWVVWKEEHRGDKTTKAPYSAHTGRRARTHDEPGRTYPDRPEDTWSSFEEAVTAYRAGGYDGIGFVFTPSDPFCGVDLDGCIDEDGEIESWAQSIINVLDSYSEFSPSGKGVKIWVKANKPGDRCRIRRFEMYDQARFFAVTVRCVRGTPANIEDRQEAIDALYARMFSHEAKQQKVVENTTDVSLLPPDDMTIIEKAMNARNGAQFGSLYAGHWQEAGFASQSEADARLCGMLVFYCGRDAERIDRLFRNSGLFRDKWDELRGSETYGQRTINKALANANAFYRWPTSSHPTERKETDADAHRDEDTPLTGSLTQAARRMERRLRQLGVQTGTCGILLPPNIDREDLEAVGKALKQGTDCILTVLNFCWGAWYNSLPNGRGVRGNIVSKTFGLPVGSPQAERKRNWLAELAKVERAIPRDKRQMERRWSFYEKVSCLPLERRDYWLGQALRKGLMHDIEAEQDDLRAPSCPPQEATGSKHSNTGEGVRVGPTLPSSSPILPPPCSNTHIGEATAQEEQSEFETLVLPAWEVRRLRSEAEAAGLPVGAYLAQQLWGSEATENSNKEAVLKSESSEISEGNFSHFTEPNTPAVTISSPPSEESEEMRKRIKDLESRHLRLRGFEDPLADPMTRRYIVPPGESPITDSGLMGAGP